CSRRTDSARYAPTEQPASKPAVAAGRLRFPTCRRPCRESEAVTSTSAGRRRRLAPLKTRGVCEQGVARFERLFGGRFGTTKAVGRPLLRFSSRIEVGIRPFTGQPKLMVPLGRNTDFFVKIVFKRSRSQRAGGGLVRGPGSVPFAGGQKARTKKGNHEN